MKDLKAEEQLIEKFCLSLKNHNRFFIDQEIINLFDLIIDTLSQKLTSGKTFYRGRINPMNCVVPYTSDEIGMPPETVTPNAGRLNPYGIRYMYMADNVETVVAELKPNLYDFITIGTYELIEPAKVIIFSNDYTFEGVDKSRFKGISPSIFTQLLGAKFSRQIDYTNKEMEYLPTQYFAEYCKHKKGIDGIFHLSSVRENIDQNNYNCIFFNNKKLKLVETSVCSVNNIKYDIQLF